MTETLRVLRALLAIAINTFREAVRNKVFGSLVFFSVLLILMSFTIGQMSLHNEVRVARNFTLFTSTLFAAVITIYSSVTLIHTELERRTIYTILSKPIHRWQFVLGKFFGVQLLLMAILLVLGLVSAALILAQGGTPTTTLLTAYGTLYLQLVIVTSITLLLASFSSPLLSGLVAFAVFVIGNLMSLVDYAIRVFSNELPYLATILKGVRFTLPDLESLNLSHEVTYGIPIPHAYLFSAVWYATSYATVMLVVAMAIFKRRDFI